jgi:hypothetical protein
MNRVARYGGILFAFILSAVILYFVAVWIIPLFWQWAIEAVRLFFIFLMKMRN